MRRYFVLQNRKWWMVNKQHSHRMKINRYNIKLIDFIIKMNSYFNQLKIKIDKLSFLELWFGSVNLIGNYCFWLSDFLKYSPLKPLGQINRIFVGSIYGMSSITNAHFVPIHWKTRPPQAIIVSDLLISKKISVKRKITLV